MKAACIKRNCRPNAWIELDLDGLCRNLDATRAVLSPTSQVILVVKANAYGHGMTTIASKAFECGVRWFLVATLEEATMLREAVPQARILLLGAVWASDVPEIARLDIVPVLVDEAQALELAETARKLGLTLACHAKIDTGMGRLGLPWEGAASRLNDLRVRGGLDIKGLCTHFASAGRAGDAFASIQEARFRHVVDECGKRGFAGLFTHAANSAAFSSRPALDLDGVRLGILVYGYGGRAGTSRVETRPLLQWKTRVLQVKQVPAGFPVGYLSTHVTPSPTWLATIDVGYSDGYSRLMSNKGHVLVGGRRARVVGRVTMNFTTIDVGPQGGVQPGDEVVLIGTQKGESLWADEVARWCQTIPYEILTNIRDRAL